MMMNASSRSRRGNGAASWAVAVGVAAMCAAVAHGGGGKSKGKCARARAILCMAAWETIRDMPACPTPASAASRSADTMRAPPCRGHIRISLGRMAARCVVRTAALPAHLLSAAVKQHVHFEVRTGWSQVRFFHPTCVLLSQGSRTSANSFRVCACPLRVFLKSVHQLHQTCIRARANSDPCCSNTVRVVTPILWFSAQGQSEHAHVEGNLPSQTQIHKCAHIHSHADTHQCT